MKMENEFRARAAGTVTEIRVAPGQAVNAGDLLLVIG
jgi:glutaconyl-CoA decarboxylase